MSSIRQRLAYLIAALSAPCVTGILDKHQHPAAAKALREMQNSFGLEASATAAECFAKLHKKALKFDAKLADAGFPAGHPAMIRCRHGAEGTMSFLNPTYVGCASQGDQHMLRVKGVEGFEKLICRIAPARNYLATQRYLEGDFHSSPRRGDYLAAKTIDLLLPLVTDYWTDLLVIDRDNIVEKTARGERLWVWVKKEGWGTWISHKSRLIPDAAVAVVEVGPDGVKQLRRAPQLELEAA